MRSRRLVAGAVAAAAVMVLAACGGGSSEETQPGASSSAAAEFPITIEHALGSTTIEAKPERVATVQWANHEVSLALGVVPVGMAFADFGDDNGDGLLPWVDEKLQELGGEKPVLFNETDGIDFEAVADTNPDVILAAYSGLTQEDYDTLSEIAPTVAYPEAPWATNWRDMIRFNSQALGLQAQGDALIAGIEGEIETAVAKAPQIAGKRTMFLTHVDSADLSEVSFYTTKDTRVQFFDDLGLGTPESIATASAGPEFSGKISAEQVDTFDDVDIIVTYGDAALVSTLQKDPLVQKVPAVAKGAIVPLPGTSPIGTAANPTPLAISYVLDEYVGMIAAAADRAGATG